MVRSYFAGSSTSFTTAVNRERLLQESVMREFFGGVVAIAEWADLVSDEHFSVDGSLLRAWASHKSLAARDGSDEPPGPDQGRNPEVDFRGKKRSNATHVSRTDPDALLASKGGGGAYLSFTTHALAENRSPPSCRKPSKATPRDASRFRRR